MRFVIIGCVVLAGCSHTQVDVGAGTPNAGVQVHVESARGLAALLGLSILAAGIYDAEWGSPAFRPAPQLDPDRRVSEQDCTQPIDYSLGNIRCK